MADIGERSTTTERFKVPPRTTCDECGAGVEWVSITSSRLIPPPQDFQLYPEPIVTAVLSPCQHTSGYTVDET